MRLATISCESDMRRKAVVVALLLAVNDVAGASVTAANDWLELSVAAERDAGMQLGDLIPLRLTVRVRAPFALAVDHLPRPGEINEWLELRTVQLELGAATAQWQSYRLSLQYQLFKAVQYTEVVEIPPLPLAFRHGDQLVARELPAWSFSVAPVIPSRTLAQELEPKPLLVPPTPDISGARRGVWVAVGLTFSAAAWWLWERAGGATRGPRPLRDALRLLRKLRRGAPDATRYDAALRCLHQALDRAYGRVLLADQLPTFLAEQPSMAALQEDLARFFARSHQWFYAPRKDADELTQAWEELVQLARRLRDAEAGRG